MSTLDENRALVRRFVDEIFAQGRVPREPVDPPTRLLLQAPG